MTREGKQPYPVDSVLKKLNVGREGNDRITSLTEAKANSKRKQLFGNTIPARTLVRDIPYPLTGEQRRVIPRVQELFNA